jgi:hypothetical protein
MEDPVFFEALTKGHSGLTPARSSNELLARAGNNLDGAIGLTYN